MNTAIRSGARLLFRVDPLPGESPRGYLCRVAQEHSYRGPWSLMEIAGLPPSGLDGEARAERVAHVRLLAPEEWRAMCSRHIKRDRFDQRSFYGEPIRTDDLNYQRPRLCPACLRERPIWWAVWDLGLIAACPIHRCLLVNLCPACNRRLAWQRSAVHRCRCGFDFRNLIPETADRDLVAIHAVIHRVAGFPAGEAAERDIAEHGFPPEMFEMKLGSLSRLILFLSSIKEKSGLDQKQRPFARTDRAAAIEIGRAAVTMLRAAGLSSVARAMDLRASRRGRGQSLSMVTAARPISIAAARSVRAKGRCFWSSPLFSFMELRKRINLNKEPSFISNISGGKPCSAISRSAASPAGNPATRWITA